MARTNFQFAKRQKELERKKKQEEKRQRRLERKSGAAPAGNEEPQADGGEAAPDPAP